MESVSYTHLRKVKKNILTSNSNGVIIIADIVIKHNEVNHTLE